MKHDRHIFGVMMAISGYYETHWQRKARRINIDDRKIGVEYPPFVIAEIGINHSGSWDVALKMVDAAAQAGAEVVKFQIHHAADEMSDEVRYCTSQHKQVHHGYYGGLFTF